MTTNIKRIAIDPRFGFSYATYYIEGFRKLFPGKVVFKIIDTDLSLLESEDYRCGFAVVVAYTDDSIKRIFVDISDINIIRERFYDWADVYAKINVKAEDLSRQKLLLIGPSFGVRLWNPVKTVRVCIMNYLKTRTSRNEGYHAPFMSYFQDYMYTVFRRLPISAYNSRYDVSDAEYAFTLNTLWYDSLTDSMTNKYRGAFIRACQKLFPRFEGGFRIIAKDEVINQFPKYKEYYSMYSDVITKQRVGLKEYLEKTYRSFVVFNVPSVSGCHGWKLGEYFAMGKVIISMPLINSIPEEQRFMNCVISVHNEDEIKKAIEQIRSSEQLRNRLRENVQSYYNDFLSPERVVESFFRFL